MTILDQRGAPVPITPEELVTRAIHMHNRQMHNCCQRMFEQMNAFRARFTGLFTPPKVMRNG